MSETTTAIAAGTWEIDPAHTQIGFTVRHLMSKVRGKFDEFEGTIVVADNLAESTATAEVQLASINTGTADRDNHLRSTDFFGIEQNVAMSFRSTSIAADGDDFVIHGDLTIKDVTKPVELKVELLGIGGDPWGGTRAGFEARTQISRKDWGIDFNVPVQGDKFMIGDRISVEITAEAVFQAGA